MEIKQKNNSNPNSWINITLASFVPQMKEKGTYDAFVKLCVKSSEDGTLENVGKVLSKYTELEDDEVYLVIEEIAKQKNEQLGFVK